ncbi:MULTISPECIES: M15 family metallopeptidase [Nocardioides]|uniref:M15 family metallopeptidase n=1 Tax=Nocardioides vastitatis TaxID=2568655 RepID=A0ABW0ZNV7_9ACTN|nr:M15 family metallopeptidase [Nocardioides sp.]THJ08153.1 peptidase M15 [Nocardioides sp.]
MTHSKPARTAAVRTRPAVRAALVVVGAALVGTIGLPSLASFSTPSPFDALLGGHGASRSTADGAVPDGVTAFDEEYPAVANLDPTLLDALRRASVDAAGQGVVLQVNSGWRSAEYQEQLLQEAVEMYGSAEEAARWVSTPALSRHVSGDAVDIGGADAAAWLSLHGAQYELCRVYDNEPWHFELRPGADERGCPVTYADPSRDPRTQQ